jgi:hypothetical protein
MLIARLFGTSPAATPQEPLDHPDLHGLSPRQLADLPLPRPWDAVAARPESSRGVHVDDDR